MRRRELLKGMASTAVGVGWLAQGQAVASATPCPAHHVVRIAAFAFSPARLSVQPGDTIAWINDDFVPHTATAVDRSWDTGEIGQHECVVVEVTAAMTRDYFCVYHPSMTAVLIFGEAGDS
ncbi:MAG: copper-binding protein [Pseudomonadota bacterium]